MAAEKIIFETIQDLLDYRITKPQKIKSIHKHKEASFCDRLDGAIRQILEDVGYNIESIKREFELYEGRIDYLCKCKCGKYIVIEVKASRDSSNSDLCFSFAIGQLLTYRTLFSKQYNIQKDKIELILLTDEDSIITLGVIDSENLDISMLVVGESGAKYYGKNGETQKGDRKKDV